jgi:membrane-associated phospholipid phosphatase
MEIGLKQLLTKRHSSFVTLLLRGFALYYLVLLSLTFAGIYAVGGKFLLTVDHIFLIIFSLVMILQRGGQFLISLSKYVILFFSFQGMRGIADNVNTYVNFDIPIAFDPLLTAGIPFTRLLQESFPDQSGIGALAIFTYVTHFFFPFLFGILLWWTARKHYEPYFVALVFTIYLGLITCLMIPVAPPWMAAEEGLIDIDHLTFKISAEYGFTSMPTLYLLINANPVAAFPSLHFALPVLIAYYAIRSFGARGLPALLYTALMGFSLVYLGEHYVFDLLGGALYAFIGIIASNKIVLAYGEGALMNVCRLL